MCAGSSDEPAPAELDAALIFAPVGALVPAALRATRQGGRVICAGIHLSDTPAFPYAALWGDRTLPPVATLTDRKRVLQRKSVSVRVNLGGRPIIKQKTYYIKQ